jgi:hypothetical protein
MFYCYDVSSPGAKYLALWNGSEEEASSRDVDDNTNVPMAAFTYFREAVEILVRPVRTTFLSQGGGGGGGGDTFATTTTGDSMGCDSFGAGHNAFHRKQVSDTTFLRVCSNVTPWNKIPLTVFYIYMYCILCSIYIYTRDCILCFVYLYIYECVSRQRQSKDKVCVYYV